MPYHLSRGVTALAIILGANAGFLAKTSLLESIFSGNVKSPVLSEARLSSSLSQRDMSSFAQVLEPGETVNIPPPVTYHFGSGQHAHYVHYPAGVPPPAADEFSSGQSPGYRCYQTFKIPVPLYTVQKFLPYPQNGILGVRNTGGPPIKFVPVASVDSDTFAGHQLLQAPYGLMYASQAKVKSVEPTPSPTVSNPSLMDTDASSTNTGAGPVTSAIVDSSNAPVQPTPGENVFMAALLALCSLILSSRNRTELRKSIGLLGAAWVFGILCGSLTLPPQISLAFAALLAGIFMFGKEDKLLSSRKRLDAVNIAVSTSTLGIAGATTFFSGTGLSALTLAVPMCLVHCARSTHLRFSQRSLRAFSIATIAAFGSMSIFLSLRIFTLLPQLAISSLAALELIAVPAVIIAGILGLKHFNSGSKEQSPRMVPLAQGMDHLGQSLGKVISDHKNETAFFACVMACIGMVSVVAFGHGAIGDMLAVWMKQTCSDANLTTTLQISDLISWVSRATVFTVLIVPLMPKILRLGALFAAFAGRLNQNGPLLHHAAMALRTQTAEIVIRDRNPFIKAVGQTVIWYSLCYAVIFAVWTVISSTYWHAYNTQTQALSQSLFEASHAAAISAYIFAIMSATWLPRIAQCELVLSTDGFLISKGFLAPLQFRPYRRWHDVSGVSLQGTGGSRALQIRFFSGGSLKLCLSQLAGKNLSRLLLSIDEHAIKCTFTDEINQLLSVLHSEDERANTLLHDDQAAESKLSSTTFSTLPSGYSFDQPNIRVLRLLSSHSFCATYLARAQGGLAILKQIIPPSGNSDIILNSRRKFEQQIQALGALQHPGLAKVLTLFDSNNQCFVLLEHIHGTNLRKVIENGGPLSEQLLKDIATQLARSLNYLHTRPEAIVHGAINPHNLTLTQAGTVKLTEFGAADQFLEGITGTVVGDASYASPESIRGMPTPQSDIYSFGATLYFLCTGRTPLALMQCRPQDLNVSMSSELSELIMRCTAFDEAERPESFEEVLHLLGASVEEDASASVASTVHDCAQAEAQQCSSSSKIAEPGASDPSTANTTAPDPSAADTTAPGALDASTDVADSAEPLIVETDSVLDVAEKEQPVL